MTIVDDGKNGKTAPRWEGVEIKIGKKTYIVPPMSFRGLQVQSELITELQARKASELQRLSLPECARYAPILHAAISRNYPELKLEDFLDEMDVRDVVEFSKGMLAAFFVRPEDVPQIVAESTLGEAPAVAESKK